MASPLSLRKCLQDRGIDPNGGIRTAMRSASVTSVRALCSIPASNFTPSLDGREATQAIQDINHTVTLVASKRTVIRIYLSSPSIGSAVTVRGELALRRSPGGPVVTIPSDNTVVLNPAQFGQLDAKRRNVQLSLNFLLPVDQTTAGPLHFSLASLTNASTGIPFDVSLNNLNATSTVTFTASAPLRVRILGISYQWGTPPVTIAPAQLDFDLINSWLRRAYPVDQVISSQAIVAATAAPPFGCGDINAQVAAIRALDVSGGTDRRTHYFGLVSDNGGFFMRGCAAAIPTVADPSAVASGPTGPATWGWDFDGSYGDWYTGHELGHTYGRLHPGFCAVPCRPFNPSDPGGDPNCQRPDDPSYPFATGQLANADNAFVGFDVGDPAQNLPMAALPGVDWHDVMTYCNNQWLSSYTYEGIRVRLAAEDNLPPGPSPGPGSGPGAGRPDERFPERIGRPDERFPERIAREEAAAERNLISVVATVNLTKEEGKIKYVNPLPQAEASRTEPDSPVILRVKGADGQVLHEYPVSVKPLSDTPGPDHLGLVDVALPVDADARAVELSIAGRAVDTFQASATPPEVRGLTRAAAERDTLSIAWEAEAGTGDDHTYNVQVSTDDGRTWQTLAVGLATPEVTIDRNQFYGAGNVLVRVIATDGFRSSVVTSEPLSIDS
jgi:hypothetical protein